MKFHEYRTLYQDRGASGYGKDATPAEVYRDMADVSRRLGQDDVQGRMAHAVSRAEWMWYRAGCWYYKVWPGVAEAMMRVKLDRPGPEFGLADTALMLRFADQRGPVHNGVRLKTALVTNNKNVLSVVVEYGAHGRDEPFKVVSVPTDVPDKTLGEVLSDPRLVPCLVDESARLDPGLVMDNSDALRLAVAVILMRRDPAFVTPDQWDHRAAFDADSVLKERVERAEVRGVRGFRIGEQYEQVPHLRRPHLGLRWTGEGRRVARIVPIKGAVVHRKKLTEVPTGHYDTEGREVE